MLSARWASLFWPTMQQELSPTGRPRRHPRDLSNAPDGATLDTPTATPGDSRAIGRALHGVRSLSSCIVGNPHVSQAIVVSAPSRTGTSASAPRWTSQRELCPRLNSLPGRDGVPVTPPSLGPGLPRRGRSSFVIQTSRQLREPRPRGAPDAHGRDGQEPRLHQRPTSDLQPEQARAAHRRRPRQGRRRWASSVDVGGAHAGDHAGRAPGHALQARRRAVRRDRADSGDAAARTRRTTSTASSCAAATTRWCRCRPWSRCARA